MTSTTCLETLQALIEELKAERKLAEKMDAASVIQLRAQVVEECARVAAAHKPPKLETYVYHHASPEAQLTIIDERRGEEIAAVEIAAKIRALAIPRGTDKEAG